jgi:hypothetical protein
MKLMLFKRAIQINLKHVLAGFFAAILASAALASKEACPREEYDMLKSMAEHEGFDWTGTLKSCTVTRSDVAQIYWADSPRGGVTQATVWRNRVQFTSGGSINLVCYRISGGRWVASGKDC